MNIFVVFILFIIIEKRRWTTMCLEGFSKTVSWHPW